MVRNNLRTEKIDRRNEQQSEFFPREIAPILLAIDLVDWGWFSAKPDSLLCFGLYWLAGMCHSCLKKTGLHYPTHSECKVIPEVGRIIHKHLTSGWIDWSDILMLSHSVATLQAFSPVRDWYLRCLCEHFSLRPHFTFTLWPADNAAWCRLLARLKSFAPVFYWPQSSYKCLLHRPG